jgi:hypothetical protein
LCVRSGAFPLWGIVRYSKGLTLKYWNCLKKLANRKYTRRCCVSISYEEKKKFNNVDAWSGSSSKFSWSTCLWPWWASTRPSPNGTSLPSAGSILCPGLFQVSVLLKVHLHVQFCIKLWLFVKTIIFSSFLNLRD